MLALVLLACTLAVGGCFRPQRLEVAGRVTLDGQPLEEGTIEFLPADGAGPTAGGLVTGGQYRLPIAPGDKRVKIQGYRVIGEERHLGDPLSPLMPVREAIVPTRYNAESTLSATVDRDHSSFDFALEGH